MRHRFLLSLLFGLIVLSLLALAGDAPKVLDVLRGFPAALLPAVLLLTLWNYALRFAKWHLYLHRLHIGAAFMDSLGIFLCGLSMAVTPGKAGELLKSVLLRRRVGTPLAVSAPVVMAERLTDGLAMMGLAATGLLLYHTALGPMAALLLLFLTVIAGTQLPVVRSRLVPWLAMQPRLERRAEAIGRIYNSARILLSPGLLGGAVAIGLCSWSGECLAFYLVLAGLGFHAGGTLLIQAAFVLAVSTLIGSATLLPGGLGTAESSSTVLLIAIVHAGRAEAVAATLLIRLCTLWFGVGVGVVSLLLFRRRFGIFSRQAMFSVSDGVQSAV
ncbi:MAG TPA: lysylphosphatidylglycerol synthase transmembrane domain-containing protein [Chloroflexota bacterium]|nr:lysylphosphatidylglycerol synthase transmembrane domain-containing protein [Chloroflexota bacterium]